MPNLIPSDVPIKPTKETYGRFQLAYDVFNKHLFDGQLPDCLITLQRRKNSYGHFFEERFDRDDGKTTDEIALNPAYFWSVSVVFTLATLTHEMVHLWQFHFGIPGRGRYHNRQWAQKMKEIGLQPTDTGELGGKETGDKVSHVVMSDGPFIRVANKLLEGGFIIPWKDAEPPDDGKRGGGKAPGESKSGKRVKYVCPEDACGQNCLSNHQANIKCGAHDIRLVPAP